jgi:hypothetical protein
MTNCFHQSKLWTTTNFCKYIHCFRNLRNQTMPSTTPTKPPSLPIHSTPHSQGSGSHCSYHSHNLQEHYKPYLKEDLKHRRTITFDAFLNDILHLSTDWIERNASWIREIVDTNLSSPWFPSTANLWHTRLIVIRHLSSLLTTLSTS